MCRRVGPKGNESHLTHLATSFLNKGNNYPYPCNKGEIRVEPADLIGSELGMVRSALESVSVFTSWLARSLLLTSMRFDSSLATKYKLKTITNR